MARTAIPIVRQARDTLATGGTLAAPLGGGIAIDQANGMKVSPKDAAKLVLIVYNSKAGNIQTTIKAGAYPPAEAAGQGDLVVPAQATVTFYMLSGLNGERFLQANGDVFIDWDAGATGVVWALECPA
jgi:hypothetical protein